VPRTKLTVIFNRAKLSEEIHARAFRGVDRAAIVAYEKAEELVPVRKVFKYRRRNVGSKLFAEQIAQGRQDVRTLSLEEALAESVQRRRLGLPSAFPTDAAGRRRPGSRPLVRTAQLTDTYNSRNRTSTANTNRDVYRVNGENILGRLEEIFDDRGRSIGHRVVRDVRAEALLSGRGRAELRRAKPGQTLGGALRKSVKKIPTEDTGKQIVAYVEAGGKEAPYAKYVEFGTRRSRAQPFMRPALAEAREKFPGLLRDALRGPGR